MADFRISSMGDNVKELMISSDGHSNEGLFYVLYSAVDGTMISYGIIDFAAITNEISSKENLSKAKSIRKPEIF